MRSAVLAVAVGCLSIVTGTALGKPGRGTLDDPIAVDAFPYVLTGDTSDAPAGSIDSYGPCAPSLDESGPERVFRFSLPAPVRVTAWVEGDGGGVDIDVHVLEDLGLSGSVATGCVARGNTIAEAELEAGEHFVVVDSFEGAAQAGPFVLHLEAIGDAWIERDVAVGVRWRARRFVDLYGPQVVHALSVDLAEPEVEIRAVAASGCQTVGALGKAIGAVGGVNGGYFGPGCVPVSLLKESGSFLAANAVTRGAFGLSAEMVPMVALVEKDQNWPEAYEAHGGGPILVTGGVAKQGSAAWSSEGFSNASFVGVNPRTFAGFDGDGRVALGTVDGRRANAKGLSLDDLAAFAAGAELGLAEAVNLDGGGSTTMWVAGATPNGVLNYPSDATQEDPAHPGSRPCSGGLFVFAPPFNHPPRFQTEPATETAVGESYAYDADAIDLDVGDVVTFTLLAGPAGMTVDPDSGEVSFAPEIDAPPSADVTIEAADDHGATSEQSYVLVIEGGTGAAGGGGGNGGGATTGGGGQIGGQGGAAAGGEGQGVPGAPGGGCRCLAAGGDGVPAPWWLWALALLFGARARRKA